MLEKLFNKIIIINLIFISYLLPIVDCQNVLNNEICNYSILNLNNSINNDLSEELLDELVKLNIDDFFLNNKTLLYLFEKEYQIFMFTDSNCTKTFLNGTTLKYVNFSNSLHLFSINGSTEMNNTIIKLAIQTKKQFNILYYYFNGSRLYTNPDISEKNYTITTNIFPYFQKNLVLEEYLFFENETIDIFNESEKIFNDICYIYKTRNETKSPELRKNLYYYKYDNDTYPLLESINNCFLIFYEISYEQESFLLKYVCKHNLNISANKIQIYNISILSREEKEKYIGPNSLKDQEKILYCYREAFNKKAIKKNIGFYISLCLVFIVFVCLIFLIIQNYDVEQKTPRDSPPKKKMQNEDDTISKKKKKVKFDSVEILSSNIKPKKKKKKKKKSRTMIDDSQNKDNDDYNNDLNWYSNNIIDDDDDNNDNDSNNENENDNNTDEDNNNNINNYNSYNNKTEIKTKKKKKGKKKEKRKKEKKGK